MPEDEQDRGTGQEAAAQEGGISRKSFIVAAGLGAVALLTAVSAAAAPAQARTRPAPAKLTPTPTCDDGDDDPTPPQMEGPTSSPARPSARRS